MTCGTGSTPANGRPLCRTRATTRIARNYPFAKHPSTNIAPTSCGVINCQSEVGLGRSVSSRDGSILHIFCRRGDESECWVHWETWACVITKEFTGRKDTPGQKWHP